MYYKYLFAYLLLLLGSSGYASDQFFLDSEVCIKQKNKFCMIKYHNLERANVYVSSDLKIEVIMNDNRGISIAIGEGCDSYSFLFAAPAGQKIQTTKYDNVAGMTATDQNPIMLICNLNDLNLYDENLGGEFEILEYKSTKRGDLQFAVNFKFNNAYGCLHEGAIRFQSEIPISTDYQQ